jgi:hypothetical protein
MKKKQAEIERIKDETKQKQDFCEHYINAKNQEIEQFKILQANLESQIEELRLLTMNDKLEQESQ